MERQEASPSTTDTLQENNNIISVLSPPEKNRRKIVLFCSALVCTVILLLLILVVKRPITSQKTQPFRENTSSSTKALSPSPPAKEQHWVLKKGGTPIYTINDTYSPAVTWNNYIFFTEMQNIIALNTDTGEIKTIYDISTQSDGLGKNTISTIALFIQHDTLYATYNAYRTANITLWTPLPVINSMHKLADGAGIIEEKGNHTWFITSEGDACWSSKSISLLDIKTHKLSKVTDSMSGCFDGLEHIGTTQDGHLIMAYHARTNDTNDESVYEYITIVSPENPTSPKTILTKQSMPKNITFATYLVDTEEVFISGEKNYTVNIVTKELNETTMTSIEPKPTPILEQKTVVDVIRTKKLGEDLQFVHE